MFYSGFYDQQVIIYFQVRVQVEELQSSFDSLYDNITDLERQLRTRISW